MALRLACAWPLPQPPHDRGILIVHRLWSQRIGHSYNLVPTRMSSTGGAGQALGVYAAVHSCRSGMERSDSGQIAAL
jgi:hypothetical protein